MALSFYAEVQKKAWFRTFNKQCDNKPSISEQKKNLSLAIPGLLAEGVGDEDGPVEC